MEKEEKIDSSESKCSSCGGDLIFSPQNQSLICIQCAKLYDIKKNENPILLHKLNEQCNDMGADYQKFVQNNKVFKCPNCGSNVVLNTFEISKKCPYCETSLVIDTGKIPGLKPDAVIPFLFDEQQAGSKFVQNVKKKWFIPNAFKKQVPENKIKGIYIPAFAFNAKTQNTYSGTLYKNESRTDSDGHTISVERDFNVSGNYDREFTDILVECSSKLNQSQIDGFLPYNYTKKQGYCDGFIRGYSVEHYNDSVENCKITYKNILDSAIRQGILAKYDYSGVKYLNVKTTRTDETYAYYLVPIYRFEYDYKKKQYITHMNGQTGKVDDNVPKSKVKIALMAILAILIVLAPIIIGFISGLLDK